MTTVAQSKTEFPADWSLADVQRHLGGIPSGRIRLSPLPGTATEKDVIAIHDRENRLFELIDGILVEKTMGWYESLLAGLIITELNVFLESHDLGKALTTNGALKIFPHMIRIPDVSFISWNRWPSDLPRGIIPDLVPELAVEVLSKSNTKREMGRKLKDYFEAGVCLVWYIDPATRTARVYTAVDEMTTIAADGVLNGGSILPGFTLSLRELFAQADRARPV